MESLGSSIAYITFFFDSERDLTEHYLIKLFDFQSAQFVVCARLDIGNI